LKVAYSGSRQAESHQVLEGFSLVPHYTLLVQCPVSGVRQLSSSEEGVKGTSGGLPEKSREKKKILMGLRQDNN